MEKWRPGLDAWSLGLVQIVETYTRLLVVSESHDRALSPQTGYTGMGVTGLVGAANQFPGRLSSMAEISRTEEP